MQHIQIVEVGPRDGWQNLKQMLTFEEKLSIIDGIIRSSEAHEEVRVEIPEI